MNSKTRGHIYLAEKLFVANYFTDLKTNAYDQKSNSLYSKQSD